MRRVQGAPNGAIRLIVSLNGGEELGDVEVEEAGSSRFGVWPQPGRRRARRVVSSRALRPKARGTGYRGRHQDQRRDAQGLDLGLQFEDGFSLGHHSRAR